MSDDPVVRVVGGNPTDEEIAAIVAAVGQVYAEESAGAVADDHRENSSWRTSRRLRTYTRQSWGGFHG